MNFEGRTKPFCRDLLLWTEDVEAAEKAVCDVLAEEGFGAGVSGRSADGFSAVNWTRLVPAPVDRRSDLQPEDVIEVPNTRAIHITCRRSLNTGDESLLLTIVVENLEESDPGMWCAAIFAPFEFALERYDRWRRRRMGRRIVARLWANGVVVPR